MRIINRREEEIIKGLFGYKYFTQLTAQVGRGVDNICEYVYYKKGINISKFLKYRNNTNTSNIKV